MVALITPFTSRNTVDVEGLKALVIRLLQDGVDGFVVCGTTSEVCTLSNDERELIVDTVIDTVNGKCPIWVGCGTNCTIKSMEYMKMVEDKKIDGIMLVVPYYNRPSQEGMYQHFYYLATHTKHPIMLYNVPKRTGVNLENETMKRLVSACSNIVAIKQASSDFSICELLKDSDVKVFCGDDGLLKECLDSGGYGIISVLGHLEIALIKKIVDDYNQGKNVDGLDHLLKKKCDIAFIESNPCGIKYLLNKKGWIDGRVRLPLSEVSYLSKKVLDAYFD